MNNLNLFVTANVAIVLVLLLVSFDYTFTVILFWLTVIAFIAFRNYIRQANSEMLRHFSILNKQLNLRLNTSTPTFFKIGWEYPSLSGVYLDRIFYLSVNGNTIFSPKPSNIFISIDVHNYGKTFEIKPQLWRNSFWDKIAGDKLNGFLGTRISSFFSKVTSYSSIHNNTDFNDLYSLETNDEKFMNKVLDEYIAPIFTQDLWPEIGTIKLDQGLMTYKHQAFINTEMERYHLEKVILVMYMLAKQIEYRRSGKI